MITGILAPSEGTIEINGKDIQKDPLEAKRQFGFVPDDPDAFLRVRGIEYLNFKAHPSGCAFLSSILSFFFIITKLWRDESGSFSRNISDDTALF